MNNLVAQGRGIRNDLLAAQVASANAQQREIQARNRLSIAWATYNRYLCRPMDTVVPLEELATAPASARAGGCRRPGPAAGRGTDQTRRSPDPSPGRRTP